MIGICVQLKDNLLRFIPTCAVGTAFHTIVVVEIILADEVSLIHVQGNFSEVEPKDAKRLRILVDVWVVRIYKEIIR